MVLHVVRKADYGPQDAPDLTPEQQYGQMQIANQLIQATGSAQSAIDAALGNVGGILGDVAAEVLMSSLSLKAYQDSLAQVERPLLQQIVDFANQPIEGLGLQSKLTMTNPDAIAMARKQAGDLAVQLTKEQHEIIRNLTALAVAGQFDVPTLGIKLRNHIGLHEKWAKAVENRYTNVYESYIKQGFDTATAQGMAKKASADYHARLIRKRALTIARTEVLRAENDGRWLGWKSSIDEGYANPNSHKRWIVRPIGACEICQALNGTVVPWDQPFGFGQQMPPRHPNCRCTALLVPPPADYKPAKPPKDLLNPSGYDDKNVFVGNIGGAIPNTAPAWAKPVAWNGQLDVGDIIYFDGMKGTTGYEIASKTATSVYYKTPTGTTAINVGDLLARGKAVAIVPGATKLSKVSIKPDAGAYAPPGAPNNAIAVNTLGSIHAGDTLYTSTLKAGQSMTVIAVDEVNARLKVMGTTGSVYWTPFNPTKNQYAIVPSANKVKSLLGMPADNVATPKAPTKTAAGDAPVIKQYEPKEGDIVAIKDKSGTFQISSITKDKKIVQFTDGTIVVNKPGVILGLPVGSKVLGNDGVVYAIKDIKGNTVTMHDGSVTILSDLKPIKGYWTVGAKPAASEIVVPKAPVTTTKQPWVLDVSTVLGKQIAKPSGSNTTYPSGVWEGTDGVKRYVKLYKDPEQAMSELLANELYAQLGVNVPKTSLSVRTNPTTGKQEVLIVTEIVENKGTVGDVGMTMGDATSILDGFIADVWLANYDAVGTGLDNVVVGKDGKIYRIDQGGSLLFRAMGAKKSGDLTQADPLGYYDNNAYYRKVFDKAGTKPLALDVRAQLGRIDEIVTKYGSIEAYLNSIITEVDFEFTSTTTKGVSKHLPSFDVKAYAKLLEGRKIALEKAYGFDAKETPRTPKTSTKPKSTEAHLLEPGHLLQSKGGGKQVVKVTANKDSVVEFIVVDAPYASDIGKAGKGFHISWEAKDWVALDSYEPKVLLVDQPIIAKGQPVYGVLGQKYGVIVGMTDDSVYVDWGQGNVAIPKEMWAKATQEGEITKPPATPPAFDELMPGMNIAFEKPGKAFAPSTVMVEELLPNGKIAVTYKQFDSIKGAFTTTKSVQIDEQTWKTFLSTNDVKSLSVVKPPKKPQMGASAIDSMVGTVFASTDGTESAYIQNIHDGKFVIAHKTPNEGTLIKVFSKSEFEDKFGAFIIETTGLEQPSKPIVPKAPQFYYQIKTGALTGVVDIPGVTFKVKWFNKKQEICTLVDEAGNEYKKVPLAALTGPTSGLTFKKFDWNTKDFLEYKLLGPAEMSGGVKPGAYFSVLLPDGTVNSKAAMQWGGEKWYTDKLKPAGVVPAGWVPGKTVAPTVPDTPKMKPTAKIPASVKIGAVVAHKNFTGNTYKVVGKDGDNWQIESSTGSKFTASPDMLTSVGKGSIIKNGSTKTEIMTVVKSGDDYDLVLSDGTTMKYSAFVDSVEAGNAGIANKAGSDVTYLGEFAGAKPAKSQTWSAPKVSYGVPYSHDEGALSFGSYEEGTDWGKKAFQKWRSGTTPEQRDAINAYTGNTYSRINKGLRDGGSGAPYNPESTDIDAFVHQRIKHIKEALDSAILGEDVIVNRGIASMPDEVKARYASLKPGDLIYDGAFQSSSVGPDAAFSGPVVLRIRMKAGQKGAYLANLSSFNNKEREFLIQAGSTMKVVTVTKTGTDRWDSKIIIDLEMVSQDPFGGVPDMSQIAIAAVSKALFLILEDLTLGKVSA